MKKFCWFLIFAIIMLTSCGEETDTVRNATVSQEEVVEVYDSEALAAHIAAARALLDSETETRTSDEVLGKIYPEDPETESSSDDGSNKSTIGYSDIVSIPNEDAETQDQPRAVITSNPKPEAVITSNSKEEESQAPVEQAKTEETSVATTTPTAIELRVANSEKKISLPPNTEGYLSATGEKFHRIDNCGNMNPNKARPVTAAEASSKGYEACENCW